MQEHDLRKTLADLPLQGLRFFAQTGSTNDAALAWAADGAPDLSLVYAEEQTRGRGRGRRTWITPPGVALAFSLILRPRADEQDLLEEFTALGALAVCEAVEAGGMQPEIKWPNDVLLDRRKFCGVLVDAVWLGEKVDAVVLGIGVNVLEGSMPAAANVQFPATCLQAAAGKPIDRLALLREILQALLYWRSLLNSPLLVRAWEHRLAFKGELVQVWTEKGELARGRIQGLERDGSLRLTADGQRQIRVRFGEVHLLPVSEG